MRRRQKSPLLGRILPVSLAAALATVMLSLASAGGGASGQKLAGS
jgi:hypothetical protein